MHYSGAVYRPPSEARSLIVQCTLGCSHNKCAFCTMYKDKKFSINPVEQVLSDLDEARAYGELKKALAARFPRDWDGYCDGKDGYVRALEARALKWYRTRKG